MEEKFMFWLVVFIWFFPAKNYLFKVSKWSSAIRCESFSNENSRTTVIKKKKKKKKISDEIWCFKLLKLTDWYRAVNTDWFVDIGWLNDWTC